MANAARASSHTTDLRSRRSVTPISRGRRERPRVHHPGAFCFQRLQRVFCRVLSRLHRAPRSIRTVLVRGRESREGASCAVPGCFGTGGRRMQSRTDWLLRREANAEHRSNDPQRHGFQGPSGARGVAVAHAGDQEKVFRADESSEAEQRRKPLATGSNPVRPPLDSSVG